MRRGLEKTFDRIYGDEFGIDVPYEPPTFILSDGKRNFDTNKIRRGPVLGEFDDRGNLVFHRWMGKDEMFRFYVAIYNISSESWQFKCFRSYKEYVEEFPDQK